MRIITPGNPKREVKRLTCRHCLCEFEYEQSDVKCDDRPCAEPYVICPQKGCDRIVNIIERK